MTLMTPAALVNKYPVSRSLIYGACKDGLLKHYRLPAKKGKRGKILISEEDWLDYLGENRREGGDPDDDSDLTFIKTK